ncbi:hypothetical protein F0U62_06250 [Cystobacter fuscus]|uniref:hypothetical protein n=1 Tax=Cystobacter fuscus TaxID=43 RepID=UPI002B2D24CC|nr:hypothetical protein F0U62_06250 [Cystobacter fuscus]
MNRDHILSILLEKSTGGWHWWNWHFDMEMRGHRTPFLDNLIRTILAIDAVMPGYAERMASTLGSIKGQEKDKNQYEQLIQNCAEILVVNHTTCAAWPSNTRFEDEPTAPGSPKNPELAVWAPNLSLGVEVKAAALLAHARQRNQRTTQAGGRILPIEKLASLAGGPEHLILPRDNPVKDFLESATKKFGAFKSQHPGFLGVLVVVWDDFMFEPITSILHPLSGLFTEKSFAREPDGSRLKFPHVDAVIVTNHQFQLRRAMGEDDVRIPYDVAPYAFDWETNLTRAAAYIPCPDGQGLPEDVKARFNAYSIDGTKLADYEPVDWVHWIELRRSPHNKS